MNDPATVQLLGQFETPAEARRCFLALRRRQLFRPELLVTFLRRANAHDGLALAFDNGLLRGMTLGGLAGVGAGLTFVVLAEQIMLAPPVLTLGLATVGAAVGGVGALLLTLVDPRRRLRKTGRAEDVLLIAESSSSEDVDWARDKMTQSGGHVVELTRAQTEPAGLIPLAAASDSIAATDG